MVTIDEDPTLLAGLIIGLYLGRYLEIQGVNIYTVGQSLLDDAFEHVSGEGPEFDFDMREPYKLHAEMYSLADLYRAESVRRYADSAFEEAIQLDTFTLNDLVDSIDRLQQTPNPRRRPALQSRIHGAACSSPSCQAS